MNSTERMRDRVAELRANVQRWSAELDADDVRGTLLEGMAKKAIGKLEAVLRQSFSAYVAAAGMTGDEILSHIGCKASLEKLTLGQMLHVLRDGETTLMRQLVKEGHGDLPAIRRGRLFTPLYGRLRIVNEDRIDFIHHLEAYEAFSEDEVQLTGFTESLLADIKAILDDVFIHDAVKLADGSHSTVKPKE